MPAVYVYITDNCEVKKLSLFDSSGEDLADEFLKSFCDFPNEHSETDAVASRIYGQDCYITNRFDYNRLAKTLEVTRQTNEFFERRPELLTHEMIDKLTKIVVIDHLATAEKKLAYLKTLK